MAEFPKTRFEHAEPILAVKNMLTALEYYEEVLGFKNAPWGGVRFTRVTRDGAGIYLSQGEQGGPGTWVWVGVDDVSVLYEEYRNTGARIRNPPINRPWALEMQVEDIDGHVLRFGSERRLDLPVVG